MVKTRLDTLPFDLKLAIYEMAKPYCLMCGVQYTQKYYNNITKYCKCEICEGCLLDKLWEKTGSDMPGECGAFLCSEDWCEIIIEIR